MFRQFRRIERDEFFLVGADCSQGGRDFNACVFLSRNKLDIPLIYHSRGVAAQMTTAVHPVLENVFDTTGIAPVVAFESNNGGASEMERLALLNRLSKYRLYTMKTIGNVEQTETFKYGYSTNTATRPILLGDWKQAVDGGLIRLYWDTLVEEHYSFIINDRGKPEAEQSAHDDLIFACAIAWQLYQTEQPINANQAMPPTKWGKDAWRIGK